MAVYNALGSGVTLPSLNPGADGPADVTIRGEQLGIPWYQAWVNNGRVYQASNPTVGTAVALTGTGYVATTPAFLLSIPAGVTVIPLHVRLFQGGTVAGGVITVIVAVDTIDRYSSGGTSIAIINKKIGGSGAPTSGVGVRASGCTFRTGATAAAVTTHIQIAAAIMTQDVSTTPFAMQDRFEWAPIANGEPAPQLVGPASLLVHSFAATTAPSWHYNFTWIEVDS